MNSIKKYDIYQSPTGNVLILNWHQSEESENDFSASFEAFANALWRNSCERAVINYSQVNIHFSPMLRKWLLENWIPRLKQSKKIKKIAFVIGSRLAHFSVQDLMHDSGSANFSVAYFYNFQSAENWAMS